MGDFLYRAEPWIITLVLHNWPVMIYLVLIVWSALNALLRPSRPALLLLYGLLILAVTWEYQKHGIRPIGGTIDYLLLEVNPDLHSVLQQAILYVLPVVANLIGLGLLVTSLLLSIRHRLKTRGAIDSNR
ncbi:MAG TPA: hypothetical protein VHS28_07530 [Chloroflexota bacterium]|nr:hypothetical protein [Chloroflexota bacterium]